MYAIMKSYLLLSLTAGIFTASASAQVKVIDLSDQVPSRIELARTHIAGAGGWLDHMKPPQLVPLQITLIVGVPRHFRRHGKQMFSIVVKNVEDAEFDFPIAQDKSVLQGVGQPYTYTPALFSLRSSTTKVEFNNFAELVGSPKAPDTILKLRPGETITVLLSRNPRVKVPSPVEIRAELILVSETVATMNGTVEETQGNFKPAVYSNSVLLKK